MNKLQEKEMRQIVDEGIIITEEQFLDYVKEKDYLKWCDYDNQLKAETLYANEEFLEAFEEWKITLMRSWLKKKREEEKRKAEDYAVGKMKMLESFEYSYLDLAKKFWNEQPFFYDKNNMWWFWNSKIHCWELTDEVAITNNLTEGFMKAKNVINSKKRSEIIYAMKMVGRKMHPLDIKKSWVQFRDLVIDVKDKKASKADPKFFNVNPIPWKVGKSSETPIMDKLFAEWVGEKYVLTLYEIIAYCCIPDYPIHLIFCFIGSGCNGKTKFQQMLVKFLGSQNCSSTELDSLLDSRFESAKLFKKLLCTLGETNFGIISKTSLLKRLVGQDMVGYEFKGKNPFDDYNYAKILINTNSLPTSTDTSEGFYRRWLIIDFPNVFSEGKDILDTIPKEEYENLACKVCKILPGLLERGKFYNQGSIDERKKAFIMASNPLSLFLSHFCERSFESYVRYQVLYMAYCHFLAKIKRRKVSRKEFNEVLLDEGLESRRTSKPKGEGQYEVNFYVEGIDLKPDWAEMVEKTKGFDTFDTFYTLFKLPFPYVSPELKNPVKVYNVLNLITKPPKITQNLQDYGIIPESASNLWESLKNIMKKMPKDNATFIDDTFNPNFVKECLSTGRIMEIPKGTYKELL